MKLVSGLGVQYARQFLPKVIKAAKEAVLELEEGTGRINIKQVAARHIHEMSSAIIWGADVNEKVGKIDYIDYDTRETKQYSLCEAYCITLTDLA